MATNLKIVSYPYIKIQFADGTGLTWKGGAPDYFTSLSHQRIVDGGNRLSINLTYAPEYGEDPNAVESAIVNARGECWVQYGHTCSQATRNYKALIYDYSVDVDHGVLMYSLSCISKAVTFNWTKFCPQKIEKKEDVLPRMEELVTKYCLWNGTLSYTFESEDDNFEIPEDGIELTGEAGPIKNLQTIAKQLTAKGDETGRYYYAIEVDDAYVGPGVIRLRKIDLQQTDAEFSFEWGTKSSDIISWKPNFQGQVAVFRGRGESVNTSGIANDTSSTISSVKLSIPSDPGTLVVPDAASISSAVIADEQFWSSDSGGNYPYKGSLTVLGQSKALSPGKSVISVNPLIQGRRHHTAGKYKVLKIIDSVSSSGFTTTYEGYRMKDDDNIYGDVDLDRTTYVYRNGALTPISQVNFYEES